MVRHTFIPAFFTVIFLLSVHGSTAEIHPNIRFQNFTTDKGLSQNTIMDMVQDRDGFVWISCENGLNKFDGFGFTAYSPVETTSGFVLNTRLRSLKLMDDGMLWIEFQDGNPYVCYHKSFGFETWGTHFLGVEQPDSLYLNSLLLCSDGKYWASVTNKIAGITHIGFFEKKEFNIKISFPTKSPDRYVFWEDGNNGLWFVKTVGLLGKIDLKTSDLSEYSINYKRKISPVDNGFYFHDDQRISFFDYSSQTVHQHYQIDQGKIEKIWFANNKLWYEADRNRLAFLDSGKEFAMIIDREKFANDYLIHSEDTDIDGNLWMGSPGLGALVFNERSKRVISIKHNPLNQQTSVGPSVNNVLGLTDGTVVLGYMYDGLSVYCPSKNDFYQPGFINSTYQFNSLTIDGYSRSWCSTEKGGIHEIDCFNDRVKSSLVESSDLQIGPMLWDGDSILWFGAWEKGLFCFDRRNGRFKNIADLFSFTYQSDNQKYIRKITRDRLNNLWVNTHDGLLKISPDRSLIQVIRPEFPPGDERNVFNYNFTTCVLSNGNLMIGAENGVTEMDQNGKWIRNFYPDGKDPNSISHKTIFSLYEDSKQRVWAGTYNGGLNCIDQETGKCRVFTMKDGLPDNSISGIIEDSLGNIWLATGKGLSYFNAGKEAFFNFTNDDGLPSNSVYGRSFHKINNRCFIVPTEKGLVTFDPLEISRRKPQNRQVVITNLEVLDSPKDFRYFVKNNESIELKPTEKVFKIRFVAPTYDVPEKISYEFKIDNLHHNWIDNGKNTELIFTNLPPGRQQLKIRVKPINNHVHEARVIPLTIRPYFYQTIWFRIGVVTGLLGLVALYFITRIARLKKLENLRMQIANDLHDEIGSSLGLISFLGYEVANQKPEVKRLEEIGVELNQISKRTAESMRDIIWFINPQNDTFDKLADHMKDFGEKMLSQIEFSFEMNFSEPIHQMNIRIKRNLYLIYKETIHNIAKHSQASTVDVQLTGNQKMITLVIRDNGIGFDPSKNYQGMGIKSLSKRASEISSTIDINSKIGDGTITKLSIQL